MYISKKELRQIAKDHELCGYINYTKPQLFARLRSEGLLPEGVNENEKDPKKCNFIKGIRGGSKKVEVKDLKTGEISTYSSMYTCAQALKVNPGTIRFCNKRSCNDNYEINILEE